MTIAVLFGGKSTEYKVSCSSACNVIDNLKDYDVIKIGITEDGKWFLTEASLADIKSGEWVNASSNKAVKADLAKGCLESDGNPLCVDMVFPVLHGKNGEDGTIQGLLECLEIPYVGCGVLSSALCMEKVSANRVFEQIGLAHAPWITFTAGEYARFGEEIIARIKNELGLPVFVKPSRAGSSVGISMCESEEELSSAVETAIAVDSLIIVEKALQGVKELEVAVLGSTDEPIASTVGRVMSAEKFFSFSSKYDNAESYNMIPADISPEKAEEIRGKAIRAYKACSCNGLARVDFFMDGEEKVYINEINTLPGFTPTSMYPQLFIKGGMSYGELLAKLIEAGLNK